MNILIEGGNLNKIVEGTRNIAISYAKKFREKGHNVVILTKRKNKVTGEKHGMFESVDGLKFYRWNNYSELLLLYKKIIKKEKIDIVQIFIKGHRNPIYYKTLKLLLKIPVVMTIFGTPETSIRKFSHKKDLKDIDLIIETSKTISDYMKSKGTKNIMHLYYGIDADKFKLKKLKKKKSRIKRILCLRYVYPELLRALEKLDGKGDIEIVFNKKSLYNQGYGLGEKFKLKKIKFAKDFEDIPKLFNSADLLIDLQSKEKHITSASPPLMILEAMACELPVLSTDIPEINEFITDGKNGFLVKENKKDEIYQKIKQALSGKRNIGKEARKTILKKFNLDESIQEYEEIYEKLTGLSLS